VRWISEEALKSWPRLDGKIVNPAYAPDNLRQQYSADVRGWAAKVHRNDWPIWLDAWLKTQPTLSSAPSPQQLPPSSPSSVEKWPPSVSEPTPDCMRSWELYAMQQDNECNSNG
jgi:hypothetical protein